MFEVNIYLTTVILLIGIIGSITCYFLLLVSIKKPTHIIRFENVKEQVENAFQKNLELCKLLDKKNDEITNKQSLDDVDSNLEQNSVDNKDANSLQDKLVCKYCKCSFDNDLDKCPYCGAPYKNE